ncbi:MAG: hypothetical protein ACI8P0_006014, partial [Planctomycetaceae bacterium]
VALLIGVRYEAAGYRSNCAKRRVKLRPSASFDRRPFTLNAFGWDAVMAASELAIPFRIYFGNAYWPSCCSADFLSGVLR